MSIDIYVSGVADRRRLAGQGVAIDIASRDGVRGAINFAKGDGETGEVAMASGDGELGETDLVLVDGEIGMSATTRKATVCHCYYTQDAGDWQVGQRINRIVFCRPE